MKFRHIIISALLAFFFSSFNNTDKEERKLLIYAVINNNYKIVGDNPSWLVGSCVELRIDTVNTSLVYHYKKKNGLKMLRYKDGDFLKEQFFSLDKLEYLKSLKISKIAISQAFGFEPPQIWFSTNCIKEEEENNRIKYIVDRHKKGTTRTIIFIEPIEIKDAQDNIVDLKLNSVNYFMYPEMDKE